MKKEEAEKVKQLHTQWHKDYFDEKIDAMVDPEPYVPQLWDWVSVTKDLYPYMIESPKVGREYQIIEYDSALSLFVMNDANGSLRGGHKKGWLVSEQTMEVIKFLRHGTAPEPVRPKVRDTVRIKNLDEILLTGRKFVDGIPEYWTKLMGCTCGKVGTIIDVGTRLADYCDVEFSDGRRWCYHLLDFDVVTEPVRPPQKVKAGEWCHRMGENVIYQCTEIEWDDTTIGQHWHYRSNGKYIGDDTSIRKVLHLQRLYEDRPFEVSDRVELPCGNDGILLAKINDRLWKAYHCKNDVSYPVLVTEIRFSKERR